MPTSLILLYSDTGANFTAEKFTLQKSCFTKGENMVTMRFKTQLQIMKQFTKHDSLVFQEKVGLLPEQVETAIDKDSIGFG